MWNGLRSVLEFTTSCESDRSRNKQPEMQSAGFCSEGQELVKRVLVVSGAVASRGGPLRSHHVFWEPHRCCRQMQCWVTLEVYQDSACMSIRRLWRARTQHYLRDPSMHGELEGSLEGFKHSAKKSPGVGPMGLRVDGQMVWHTWRTGVAGYCAGRRLQRRRNLT